MSKRQTSLEEIARAVRALSPEAKPVRGARSVAQSFNHCAAAVELSLSGYPSLRPAIVRGTIGRLVLRWFLFRGAMSHNVDAGIPGVADAASDADFAAARDRLLQAITDFEAWTGATAPHFVYGPVTKEQYARMHAMHLADHLSAIEG